MHNPGANLAMKALQAGFQDSQSRKRMSVQAGAGAAAPERRRSSRKAGLQQIRMTDEPPSDVTRQVSGGRGRGKGRGRGRCGVIRQGTQDNPTLTLTHP